MKAAPDTGGTPAVPDGADEPPRRVLFEAFAWYREDAIAKTVDGRQAARLASTTLDLARGVATLLRIMERDEVEGALSLDGCEPIPALLGSVEYGDLRRLGIVAMEVLADRADAFIEGMKQPSA